MKFIFIAFFALISTGCVAGEQFHKEKMYDLSSKFKDLAQSADGIVKFDHEYSKLDISILQYMQVKYPEKIKPFDGYIIKESVESKMLSSSYVTIQSLWLRMLAVVQLLINIIGANQ